MAASPPDRFAWIGSFPLSAKMYVCTTLDPVLGFFDLWASPTAKQTMGLPSSRDGPRYRMTPCGFFLLAFGLPGETVTSTVAFPSVRTLTVTAWRCNFDMLHS